MATPTGTDSPSVPLTPDRVSVDAGFVMSAPHGLERISRVETVVVPPTNRLEYVPAEVFDALRRAHKRGCRIISLCTGAFVLAEAGLLDGRRATTHWAECDELARRHPDVSVDPGVLYVDEGDILTSAGSAASIDLCLHVVRQDYGTEIATRLAATWWSPRNTMEAKPSSSIRLCRAWRTRNSSPTLSHGHRRT